MRDMAEDDRVDPGDRYNNSSPSDGSQLRPWSPTTLTQGCHEAGAWITLEARDDDDDDMHDYGSGVTVGWGSSSSSSSSLDTVAQHSVGPLLRTPVTRDEPLVAGSLLWSSKRSLPAVPTNLPMVGWDRPTKRPRR